MTDLKPYIKRFRNRKVWDAFVLEAFQWFRTYAIENNNLYPELDKEIMETAKSVANTIWNEERDTGISKWGIYYINMCITNIDDRDGRVCLGRWHHPQVEKLVRKIENDKAKSDWLDSITDC